LTLKDTEFGFTVLVNNMTLSMHIDHLNVDKIVITTDNIGGLKPFLMKTAFNADMLVAIPIANSVLSSHTVTLPDHFTQFFLLSDIVFSYLDSYLMLGLTITFVNPFAIEEINAYTDTALPQI
jgi:hypothetical protein